MEPDVVFVGDSIVANLQCTDLWEKWFAPMHCLNFGIGGDQTQHVLWRLRNGELEFIKPKVGVIACSNAIVSGVRREAVFKTGIGQTPVNESVSMKIFAYI